MIVTDLKKCTKSWHKYKYNWTSSNENLCQTRVIYPSSKSQSLQLTDRFYCVSSVRSRCPINTLFFLQCYSYLRTKQADLLWLNELAEQSVVSRAKSSSYPLV